MQIYKFGGASVKNADSVKNLAEILRRVENPCIVVISAMGKTTNMLEKLTEAYFTSTTGKVIELFDQLKTVHIRIFNDLIRKDTEKYQPSIEAIFNSLQNKLNSTASLNYDYEYDQIVPYGELLSTRIVQSYLEDQGIDSEWEDVRKVIRTDNQYRAACIDWEVSQNQFEKVFSKINRHIITQGFIGSTREGITTTLGREGSDYTASVLAYLANATDVTIWKDVPGLMNADPKEFPDSRKLDLISYQEAIELAFYGAKVIHPKTIQPLKQKGIPLRVKSFLDPRAEGSIIRQVEEKIKFEPVYILKNSQFLISISHRDLSFIMERQISEIYALFDKHKARVNLSQNSAVSYSVSVSCDDRRIPDLITDLRKHYRVLYNEKLQLITIRHYNEECIKDLLEGKEVLLEQRSRNTARFVVR